MLDKFENVVLEELPTNLLCMRNNQHQMDLIPKANLPNLPQYTMSLKENEILIRNLKNYLEKGHIKDGMSPCKVLGLLTINNDETWRMCTNSNVIN